MTNQASQDFAAKLQNETSGCRLNTYQMTARRSMNKAQIERVAQTFGADIESVGGSRAVLDRKHELIKPVYAALTAARTFVDANTLDYPEKGLRLVKLSRIEWIQGKIAQMRDELNIHLEALDAGWADVKEDARKRLEDLYSESDYPTKPSQCYGIEVAFPAIKPDDRLLTLHPELYKIESQRIASRFDEAVKIAEAAAADELGKLLGHFIERLGTNEDGKAKTLKGSTLENIREFTDRFKALSIGSNADLDALVDQVEQLASGIDITQVRKADPGAKDQLKTQLAGLLGKIDELVIVRPVRELDLD